MFGDAERQRKRRLHFYDCIKPIHVISRIFGSMPFTIHVSSNGRIAKACVGVLNAVWLICMIMLNLVFAYFAFYSSRSIVNKYSSVAHLSDHFLGFFQLLMCISSIILSVFNCNRFLKILRELVAFDNNVSFVASMRGNVIGKKFLLFFFIRSNRLELSLISHV